MLNCCKYCKHNKCSISYDLDLQREISRINTCKITHKEHQDYHTCKRFKYGIEALAC